MYQLYILLTGHHSSQGSSFQQSFPSHPAPKALPADDQPPSSATIALRRPSDVPETNEAETNDICCQTKRHASCYFWLVLAGQSGVAKLCMAYQQTTTRLQPSLRPAQPSFCPRSFSTFFLLWFGIHARETGAKSLAYFK